MPLFNCAGGNGGGGGGTSDYEQLSNLPQVNNNILIGNKSASDLGLVGAVTGKGLSTNDYTDTDKAIVDGVTSALADKVDKVTGKGLSTNDYDDTAKGIVDGVTSALAGKVSTTSVGSANGVAELDANGKVPSSQLPSYVDDVLEYADVAHFPATGETGKIYIAEDTNKTYRWSGSDYVEISESLALGETNSTAYAGNKGKANADAIAGIKNGTSINSFSAVETALAGKANSSDLGDKSNLTTTDKSNIVSAINEVNGKANTYGIYTISNATSLSDFFLKLAVAADNDLSNKPDSVIFNITGLYENVDFFYGVIERTGLHNYFFTLIRSFGSKMYCGYADIPNSSMNVYEYSGTLVS